MIKSNPVISLHLKQHHALIIGLSWWLRGKKPARQCSRRRFLPGSEDPLEKMATTPVNLPGKSHGRRAFLSTVHGVSESRHDSATEHTFTNTIVEHLRK